MIIKRDFTFNKDILIDYFEKLKPFVGQRITQTKLAQFLKERYPNTAHYNALDRKFATLKFYGFVYFTDKKQLMFNDYFGEYVSSLKKGKDISSSFLKVLSSSKYKYFENNKTNFFELLISLMQNSSIQYLDHIDLISYVQHFNLFKSQDELFTLLKNNRNNKFIEKVKSLEGFYAKHNLGNIAIKLHDAKYLFSFLESNGFYTYKNSLQSKIYFQGNTPRKLEDRRLYLSKELLNYISGFEYESIIDEIEYNSEPVEGFYQNPDKDIIKLIDPSNETGKTIIKRYKTDRKLRNNALMNSAYKCEIARLKGKEHKTFFARRNNKSYAEVHHLIPMHAQEDDLFIKDEKLITLDQISNLVVLCPTCHSKIHYGKNEEVKKELELLFDERKGDLIKNDLNIKKRDLLKFYNI